MKLAVQSIAWGDDFDLPEMLQQIKAIGFTGVELFHHPKALGSVVSVHDAFVQAGITLLGSMEGGTTAQKRDFVSQYASIMKIDVFDPKCRYLYVDDWIDASMAELLDEGFRIALHPHMYRPIQTLKEAELVLNSHSRILFLPDTAHLTVAGEDVGALIEKWHKDNEDRHRLAAIHVKDWNEDVGRSFQFYARGFCPLGKGNVNLKDVFHRLRRLQYDGWIVWELDIADDPIAAAKAAFQWLQSEIGEQR